MISRQQSIKRSPHMGFYDLIVPKDNMLRQINDLVDFTFVYEEFKDKYLLDNGRKAIDPIRMLNYLLLKPSMTFLVASFLPGVSFTIKSVFQFESSLPARLRFSYYNGFFSTSSYYYIRILKFTKLIDKSLVGGIKLILVISQ